MSKEIRAQFPFLQRGITYLDTAATSLKPESVISAEADYYRNLGVNTGRGNSLHNFETTTGLEEVRTRIAEMLNVSSKESIIFTQNTTDSINIVAQSLENCQVTERSNIVITQLEHHSNYTPWLALAEFLGVKCRIIPIKNYSLDYSYLDKYIDEDTIITAITGMSNLTGEKTDLERVIKRVRSVGSKILVDGAQLICHETVDLTVLDIDYFCFSTHKLYGTFGLGILYGKKELLDEMKPARFGGNMVSYIKDLNNVYYKPVPTRFESGTQNPAAIYAFGETLNFLKKIPLDKREEFYRKLSIKLIDGLNELGGIKIYSKPGPIISFNIEGIHPHDASEFFDKAGIIIRTGNLCASPFFSNLKESGVIRVSLGIYNTSKEIDLVLETVKEIKEFFL